MAAGEGRLPLLPGPFMLLSHVQHTVHKGGVYLANLNWGPSGVETDLLVFDNLRSKPSLEMLLTRSRSV